MTATEPTDQTTSGRAGKVLWLDPRFGASGDMILGTLLGLGAPVDRVRRGLQALDVDGWTLDIEPAMRCSLAATRAVVASDEGHHHRTWSSIDAMLAGSGLPDPVKAGSRRTFRRLGEVEAGIHRVDIDSVHFHEVGAIDAIVDIVGSWLALDALGVLAVIVGPVGLGHGSVGAAHGTLPVPAPATAELLIGAAVTPVDVAAETVTPTGAALLATMADRWGPIPAGVLLATVRGAGGRDPDHYPNVLTGYLLAIDAGGAEPTIEQQPAVLLTTNLDDVTPEVIANTIARCLAEGADDAWASPIVMKKGRPAVELSVLCREGLAHRLRDLVMAETATLGLRVQPTTKHVAPRRFETTTVRGQSIAIKVGPFGIKPEYDDLKEASEKLGIPVRQLATEALMAYAGSAPDGARQAVAGPGDGESFNAGISKQTNHEPNS